MECLESHQSFQGTTASYRHFSKACNNDMQFSIFMPEAACAQNPVPVLYWLSGLTCNEHNFFQKAGAQRVASQLGLAIVAPDTSPRGDSVPDDAAYDLGCGAGFYVNATEQPWSLHYHMYDYVTDELPNFIESHFNVTSSRAISGHSMGGHGALICALRNPKRYQSCSAFSPIACPSLVPWGQKAFENYLGDNTQAWQAYDAWHLLDHVKHCPPIRIDVGLADEFKDTQLRVSPWVEKASSLGLAIEYHEQVGFDHSYYFIASFIEQHLRFHAGVLNP